MVMDPNEFKRDLLARLNDFTGTECYYRHPSGLVMCTDGVMFLMKETGAMWIADVICQFQSEALDRRCDGFQLWMLRKDANLVEVTCRADSDTPILLQGLVGRYGGGAEDFPLDELKLYVEGTGKHRVLLLPSEH